MNDPSDQPAQRAAHILTFSTSSGARTLQHIGRRETEGGKAVVVPWWCEQPEEGLFIARQTELENNPPTCKKGEGGTLLVTPFFWENGLGKVE